MEEVSRLDSQEVDDDQAWYIISSSWLRRWRAFVQNDILEAEASPGLQPGSIQRDPSGLGVLPPGPITNEVLLSRKDKITPLKNLRKVECVLVWIDGV